MPRNGRPLLLWHGVSGRKGHTPWRHLGITRCGTASIATCSLGTPARACRLRRSWLGWSPIDATETIGGRTRSTGSGIELRFIRKQRTWPDRLTGKRGAFSEQRGSGSAERAANLGRNAALPDLRSSCSPAEPDWFSAYSRCLGRQGALSAIAPPTPAERARPEPPLCSENALSRHPGTQMPDEPLLSPTLEAPSPRRRRLRAHRFVLPFRESRNASILFNPAREEPSSFCLSFSNSRSASRSAASLSSCRSNVVFDL